MHIEKPADIERWIRPEGPEDKPESGYAEWLAAEIEAGIAELDAGKAIPAAEIWYALTNASSV